MQLRIWDQGKSRQVGVIFISRLNRDGLRCNPLEGESLERRRNARNRLQLGLELADGP